MLVELEGGPYDGELLARSVRPAAFVWIRDGTFHTRPVEGGELYRLRGCRRAVAGGAVLKFAHAQHAAHRCEECGWFVPRVAECVLCGSQIP